MGFFFLPGYGSTSQQEHRFFGGVPTSVLRFDPANRQISMRSLRIRGILVSGGAVGPKKIENVTALVHNMTPSRIGYGQYPSCQTQPEGHSKHAYASQSIQ